MLALIDADIITYRNGYAAQKGSVPDPFEDVMRTIDYTIGHILAATDATDQRLFLTGDNNFREDVATVRPYKGNRSKEKPYYYNDIREFLVMDWGAEVVDGQEADDALGIVQWTDLWSSGVDATTCICTIDKDLNCIPGFHYNWVKEKYYWVNEHEANSFFYHQLLTGDTTDNIVGIPGVGQKTAEKILDGCTTREEYLRQIGLQYAIHYDDPEAIMTEMGRLLWIRREEEELWEI